MVKTLHNGVADTFMVLTSIGVQLIGRDKKPKGEHIAPLSLDELNDTALCSERMLSFLGKKKHRIAVLVFPSYYTSVALTNVRVENNELTASLTHLLKAGSHPFKENDFLSAQWVSPLNARAYIADAKLAELISLIQRALPKKSEIIQVSPVDALAKYLPGIFFSFVDPNGVAAFRIDTPDNVNDPHIYRHCKIQGLEGAEHDVVEQVIYDEEERTKQSISRRAPTVDLKRAHRILGADSMTDLLIKLPVSFWKEAPCFAVFHIPPGVLDKFTLTHALVASALVLVAGYASTHYFHSKVVKADEERYAIHQDIKKSARLMMQSNKNAKGDQGIAGIPFLRALKKEKEQLLLSLDDKNRTELGRDIMLLMAKYERKNISVKTLHLSGSEVLITGEIYNADDLTDWIGRLTRHAEGDYRIAASQLSLQPKAGKTLSFQVKLTVSRGK